MNRTKNCELFIQRAIILHKNKYDYSKVVYKNAITHVIIICEEHGEFNQTPDSHLHNHGCKNCAINKVAKIKINKAAAKFITQSIEKHGDKYDYSKVVYKNAISHVIIICKKHGDFEITPDNHLRGKGCFL